MVSIYLGCRFEPITQRIIIAPLQSPFLPLPFSSFDEVLQTPRALGCGFATFGAPALALLTQLILPLSRDRQLSEFVFNRSSHFNLISIVKLLSSTYCSFPFDRSSGPYTQNK